MRKLIAVVASLALACAIASAALGQVLAEDACYAPVLEQLTLPDWIDPDDSDPAYDLLAEILRIMIAGGGFGAH